MNPSLGDAGRRKVPSSARSKSPEDVKIFSGFRNVGC